MKVVSVERERQRERGRKRGRKEGRKKGKEREYLANKLLYGRRGA